MKDDSMWFPFPVFLIVFFRGMKEAAGPPVEVAAESRRKLNESTETSNGNQNDRCGD